MAAVVVQNDALGGVRVVIDHTTLPQYETRGWVGVGPCSDPLRDPLLTDAEQADADAALAARLAALLEQPAPAKGPRKA